MDKGGTSSILGHSRVLNISNITTVGISNLVVDSLGPAVRKGNLVGSRCSITITVLPSIEVGSRVVISDSIVVGIDSGLIIGGLLVGSSMDRGMVGRGMDRSMDNRGMDHRGGMVDRGMDRSSVVDRGSSVVDRGSSVVDRGSSMVDRGSIVDRGMRKSSWSMNSYSSFLISTISVDALGSSVGLAAD